jgi:hypothetical protein
MAPQRAPRGRGSLQPAEQVARAAPQGKDASQRREVPPRALWCRNSLQPSEKAGELPQRRPREPLKGRPLPGQEGERSPLKNHGLLKNQGSLKNQRILKKQGNFGPPPTKAF